jgi:hypothetical protein
MLTPTRGDDLPQRLSGVGDKNLMPFEAGVLIPGRPSRLLATSLAEPNKTILRLPHEHVPALLAHLDRQP